MNDYAGWVFVPNQRRHTQDGPNLVLFMKNIGRGLRPVRAVDVGCGDGIIAFEIFKHRKASEVVAFDVLKAAASTAAKNLEPFVKKGCCRTFRSSAQNFFKDKKNFQAFDLMAINPPYFGEGSGHKIKNSADRIARHDSKLNVVHWAKGASRILHTGGELYCVFPTERLAELFFHLSKARLEPKELWWLKNDKRRRRFFLRAVKGGKPGLAIYPDFDFKNCT